MVLTVNEMHSLYYRWDKTLLLTHGHWPYQTNIEKLTRRFSLLFLSLSLMLPMVRIYYFYGRKIFLNPFRGAGTILSLLLLCERELHFYDFFKKFSTTFYSWYLHSEKSFFDSKKISLIQTILCIAIRSNKSFFDLKKSFDCFLSLNLRHESLRSHMIISVIWLIEIYSLV